MPAEAAPSATSVGREPPEWHANPAPTSSDCAQRSSGREAEGREAPRRGVHHVQPRGLTYDQSLSQDVEAQPAATVEPVTSPTGRFCQSHSYSGLPRGHRPRPGWWLQRHWQRCRWRGERIGQSVWLHANIGILIFVNARGLCALRSYRARWRGRSACRRGRWRPVASRSTRH